MSLDTLGSVLDVGLKVEAEVRFEVAGARSRYHVADNSSGAGGSRVQGL